MNLNRFLDSKAWSLHCEQYLRQALELQCGRPVFFERFKARTTASSGWKKPEYQTESRTVEAHAIIKGFNPPFTQKAAATFRLNRTHWFESGKGGTRWVFGESQWPFAVDMMDDNWDEYLARVILFGEDDVLPTLRVRTSSRYATTVTIGTSFLDREIKPSLFGE